MTIKTLPRGDLDGATIVFDLDGTLVDTAPDIRRALNHVLESEGLPIASLEDVRRFVGAGSRALIERFSAAHGVIHAPGKLDLLTESYVEVYAADIASMSVVFEGLDGALGALKRAGARLCVCTNKRTGLSVQLLEAVGMTHWFHAVIGADSVANRKPHADHFLAAVSAAGGTPSLALMVGDSAADVGAARSARAPVIVYAYGYADTAPELLGADAVLTHYSDLLDLALRLLAQRQPIPLR